MKLNPIARFLSLFLVTTSAAVAAERPPNVIVIFADDMGYADISPFGAPPQVTPNLSRLASKGVKLTSFYSAFSSCSCSRAALLTGCYPARVGMRGNFMPTSPGGLNPNETTIAEMLKQKGYATGMVGKWHLGHHPQHMPTAQGFDMFYGFPYSHDMWPYHPLNDRYQFAELPLYDGKTVIDADVRPDEQRNLSERLTSKAVEFINQNKETPFFLYFAQTYPHVPIYISDEFESKTGLGTYADCVAELDHGVGEVMKAVEENGIEGNTLVIFSSDNGPWTLYGDHGGSAGPLRGSKGTVFDGGYRVPGIISWPGTISACQSEMVCGTIDLLPTIAAATGASLPTVPIDGKNLLPALTSETPSSPHDAIFFRNLAVRSGKWKLVLPHASKTVAVAGKSGLPGRFGSVKIALSLFNLEQDIGETNNVADAHPEVVTRLRKLLDEHAGEMKRKARPIGKAGRVKRPSGEDSP